MTQLQIAAIVLLSVGGLVAVTKIKSWPIQLGVSLVVGALILIV